MTPISTKLFSTVVLEVRSFSFNNVQVGTYIHITESEIEARDFEFNLNCPIVFNSFLLILLEVLTKQQKNTA